MVKTFVPAVEQINELMAMPAPAHGRVMLSPFHRDTIEGEHFKDLLEAFRLRNITIPISEEILADEESRTVYKQYTNATKSPLVLHLHPFKSMSYQDNSMTDDDRLALTDMLENLSVAGEMFPTIETIIVHDDNACLMAPDINGKRIELVTSLIDVFFPTKRVLYLDSDKLQTFNMNLKHRVISLERTQHVAHTEQNVYYMGNKFPSTTLHAAVTICSGLIKADGKDCNVDDAGLTTDHYWRMASWLNQQNRIKGLLIASTPYGADRWHDCFVWFMHGLANKFSS